MSTQKITPQASLPPEIQDALGRLKDNFIICMLKRAGGSITFTLAEVDEAEAKMTVAVENGCFKLELSPIETELS